ncbi:Hypothetical protein D9617_8g049250 [Elsinoe fawcettii]|nr:Hypothetical protein D9617_8g049250 [Elsinoe fawcettii]
MAWQDGPGDDPAPNSTTEDQINSQKYAPQHSPSNESKISSSSAFSKSSGGSSFARLLGRRKNDAHTFKQNRKAARSLALACPATPGFERPPKSTRPIIVEDSTPEPFIIRQPSGASILSESVLRGSTPRVRQSPTLTPTSSRTAAYLPQTPSERSFDPEVETIVEAPKQRPFLRRGRSSRSTTFDQTYTPSPAPGSWTLPAQQSPLPSPRLDFRPRNIERSTIEEDQAYRGGDRLGSPLYSPLEFINSHPSIAKPASTTRRSSFLSSLWKRRASPTVSQGANGPLPSPYIIMPGEVSGTPVTTTSPSRPSYFSKRRHRSEDTMSSISPHTIRASKRRSKDDLHTSPRVYMDVTEWLQQSSTPMSAEYIASDGKQYPRMYLTSPGGPSFLPSEMRRVNTPPVRQVASAGGHRGLGRNFFADVNDLGAANLSRETLASQPQRKRRKERQTPGPERSVEGSKDFFRMRIDQAMDAPDDQTTGFSFDIPDHLPNSPLCPLHPKHHGGQKLICPMHGRAKNMPV